MPYIETIKIKNYRILKDITLKGLQPLNIFLGSNGSGKSTLLDAFAFLYACLQGDVNNVIRKRGGFDEVCSREAKGPIMIELYYREQKGEPLINYGLKINSEDNEIFVEEEYLAWKPDKNRKFRFLDVKRGKGHYISGKKPKKTDEHLPIKLYTQDILAIKSLGQLADNPRIANFCRFIETWFFSYFRADLAKGFSKGNGIEKHISSSGENVAKVMQYLDEQHPEVLNTILKNISKRIPLLENIKIEHTIDNRLILQFKDKPFSKPFLANYVSDGTIKMLAYLILLNDPSTHPLIWIEEIENGLYPKILGFLIEELRSLVGIKNNSKAQVFLSTHSPYLINWVEANELWIMKRNEKGYTIVERADKIKGISEFIDEGAILGDLWTEDYF